MTDNENYQVLDQEAALAAFIRRSANFRPFTMQRVVLHLDTARTESNLEKLPFPFTSVFVRDASDPLAKVSLVAHSDDIQATQNAIDLKINDSFSFGNPISKAYFKWEAQAGKTITLYFFLGAEMKSGSQLSLNGGGVSINDGAAFSTAVVALVAVTPTVIFAASATRKVGTFENETGADIWVGISTVSNAGATKGVRVPAGGIFEWRNTSALYGYSVAGGSIVKLEET